MDTPAKRLRHARKLRGMNQVQLALAAGVSTGTVGNIESGTRGIQGSALKLAKALKVDPNWLATGEGDAPHEGFMPSPARPGSAPSTATEAGTPSAASADPGRALRELAQFFAHTPQSTRDTVATLTASAIKDPATLPDCLRALDALAQYSAASIETSAISKAKA